MLIIMMDHWIDATIAYSHWHPPLTTLFSVPPDNKPNNDRPCSWFLLQITSTIRNWRKYCRVVANDESLLARRLQAATAAAARQQTNIQQHVWQHSNTAEEVQWIMWALSSPPIDQLLDTSHTERLPHRAAHAHRTSRVYLPEPTSQATYHCREIRKSRGDAKTKKREICHSEERPKWSVRT